MSDPQLFKVILQDCELPSTAADVAARIEHFNATGELPARALAQHFA